MVTCAHRTLAVTGRAVSLTSHGGQLPALHPLSRILGHVCEVLLLLYERCPAFPWGILVGSLGVVCLTEKKYFKKCEGAR